MLSMMWGKSCSMRKYELENTCETSGKSAGAFRVVESAGGIAARQSEE